MFRFLFFAAICIFTFTLSSSAQNSSCVQGDFVDGYGAPGEGRIKEFFGAENRFCSEVKQNPNLSAIYGFIKGERNGKIIRIYKDKAVFTYYENPIRYRERELSAKEFDDFNKMLGDVKPENQPPLREKCTDFCFSGEFIGITGDKGYRVSIFSDWWLPEPMYLFRELFDKWIAAGNFTTNYYIAEKNNGFRIHFADDYLSALAVWKNGDDMRVLIRDDSKLDDDWKAADKFLEKSNIKNCGNNYGCRWKILKKVDELQQAHYVWREFKDGKPGKAVSPPFDATRFNELWRIRGNKNKIFNVSGGLFFIDSVDNLTLIHKGDYRGAVISEDGHWLVSRKEDENCCGTNLVRINLLTKEEYKINSEPIYHANVEAFLEDQNKFLLAMEKECGEIGKPYQFEYFLLDAETGKLEKVSGDFTFMPSRYSLQPANRPNIYWAAKSLKSYETVFGLYNTETFTFTPVAEWSDIPFGSEDMWVDEKERRVYFVYDGDVLSLPLPTGDY